MTRRIKLVGLDCGSTTTSAVVAAARLTTSAMGRVEISQMEQIFRSDVVFTPFDGDEIDACRLAAQLDDWLASTNTEADEIFGGGALVTGLAAQRKNVSAVTNLIESRMADSLIATADDPCLESWLAFMGNCHALSVAHPQTPILNLDVGGGTTNLALGVDGQVIATGCLFVGARHFQFASGTYQLTGVSPYAMALLEHLHIGHGIGDTLSSVEIDSILDFYVRLIEAAVEGNPAPAASTIGKRHVQVPLHRAGATLPGATLAQSAITLSGGVGQLVYDQMRGAAAGGVTQFGDLGGELAARIARSPLFAGRMRGLAPEGLGRATVYGLLRHSTELSGSTLYLPDPRRLPLKNVPIVGRIGPEATDEQLTQALDLAARGAGAACLQIDLEQPSLERVRSLGGRLADLLEKRPILPERVLVLLVPENLGKVLGGYITRWGTLPMNLIVVDEVPNRDAQFVRLGRSREGVVPLWLYAVR
jgi:ethanolamine utilization protein EutA